MTIDYLTLKTDVFFINRPTWLDNGEIDFDELVDTFPWLIQYQDNGAVRRVTDYGQIKPDRCFQVIRAFFE